MADTQEPTKSASAKPRVLSGADFWKDRKAEFEKYEKEYHDLAAHWNAVHLKWVLSCGSKPHGINEADWLRKVTLTFNVFMAIAGKAVTELPGSGVIGNAERWRLWLDLMRNRGWGFRVTGQTPCTEQEWDTGVKDGKPLAKVRNEQKYSTGDEWKALPALVAPEAAEVADLAVDERISDFVSRSKAAYALAREGKRGEGLHRHYHWLESGTIEHVFESSARFCEVLSDRAFELEAASQAPAQPKNGSASNGAVEPEQPKRKRRGAPIKISEARKARALAIKNEGGSYRDAAITLYDTLYPSNQQVKNASKHLALYRKRIQPSPTE